MKLLDFLRKIGVFRSGAVSGTYKNAKDRPDEFLYDGVFDAKKDMTSPKEIKEFLGIGKKDEKQAKTRRRLILVALFAVLLLILLFVSWAILSFSFWFWIILALGAFLLYTFYARFFVLGAFSIAFFYVFGIIFLLFSVTTNLIYVGINGTDGLDSDGFQNSELLQYDKKVFKVVSKDGSVTGYAGVTAKKSNVTKKYYLFVHYDILVRTKLPTNGICYFDNCSTDWQKWVYDYAANILTNQERSGGEKTGITTASPVRCNKEAPLTPSFEFRDGASWPYNCPTGFDWRVNTDLFNINLAESYSSIEDLNSANILEIYDAASFWEKTDETTHTRNDKKAVNDGRKKVREFSFSLEEVAK